MAKFPLVEGDFLVQVVKLDSFLLEKGHLVGGSLNVFVIKLEHGCMEHLFSVLLLVVLLLLVLSLLHIGLDLLVNLLVGVEVFDGVAEHRHLIVVVVLALADDLVDLTLLRQHVVAGGLFGDLLEGLSD